MAARRFAFAALLCCVSLCGCGTTTTTQDPPEAGCPTVILDGHDVVASPPDGAAACPSGSCNYQSQAGCASGLACRPQFSATSPDVAPGCEPAGSGESGDPCLRSSDCAVGFACAGGSCRKQCCGGDWSACPEGERCYRAFDVVAAKMTVDSGMLVCFKVNDCDPLDPSPCPGSTDRECKIIDPTGAVACVPLSSAHEGDACGSGQACAAGLYCVAGTCRKLCRAEACGEPACTSDEGSCVHFNRDPVGVGECTPGW